MLKVANRKIIRKLSLRSFLVNRTRNVIAIIAIALTALLFTSVFTIVSSLNYSIQMSTMRMVGGSAHAGFKSVTEEQVEELRNDKLVKQSGANLMLTILTEAPFNKHQTELRYGEAEEADLMFATPTTGTMPQEKYEIAMDTKVLELLGLTPKLGEQVTLTYPLGSEEITETFTLSGYWEFDDASSASEVWLSEEYVKEQLASVDVAQLDGIQGTWSLDVKFANSQHIEENLSKLAQAHGYEIEDPKADNYLNVGVNWAYTSTKIDNSDTIMTYAGLAVICVLVFVVGYLIIYNIFGISVTNDLHFYGMLKTIGATRKQIKRIITLQAVLLAVIGIPIGLLGGFLIGNGITKVIVSNLSETNAYVSYNLWIFLGAAIFAFLTVMISCHRPGQMAGKVSPIEALHYVEGGNNTRKYKRGNHGAKILHMAAANVGRSKKKTIFVLLSLSLSVVLFSSVYTFVVGFDLNKFTEKFTLTDFIIGSANYFSDQYYSSDDDLTEEFIQVVESQGDITESGRVYGYHGVVEGYFTLEQLEQYNLDNSWFDSTTLQQDSSSGLYPYDSYLYGLDEFAIEQLKLVDGTLDSTEWTTDHPIIQLINDDDYGNPIENEVIYEVGDTVTLHYVTEYDYDEQGNLIESSSIDKEYQVVATAVIPGTMSYRYYGYSQFALPSEEFISDTMTQETMIYLYNVEEDSTESMNQFVQEYTTAVNTEMDYESRDLYNGQFQSIQNMFLIIGGSMAVIVGLIGILNFVNTIITSIHTRRAEFAVMQSIGMTGAQLKTMMIAEGLMETMGSILIAGVVYTILGFGVLCKLETVCWFFSFHYTVIPILLVFPIFLILGVLIPMLSYQHMSRKSVVERLRELNG